MENTLLTSGYVFNQELHIWARLGFTGINYSDGDETEQRIASVINQARDITILSTDLRQHCTDWPSLYHLSGTRANIMRPFESILKGDVLEIGAGCGAITRYLGECGANVLALEGSLRRAAIARSRTRDLENVTVLAEKFDQFQCNSQFDVITLIGVLEYANLFTSRENPPLAMLERIRSLLKPEGKLIIAIENQLGLKYFAGAPEDHLGEPMVGIEGRYRKGEPQTFGRKVLTGMLEQAGFAAPEFLAPCPDYKLPVSILTEEGVSNKNFDAAAFAWQSARRDPQLPAYCNFSLELAWPEVFENELGLDVANSFLIIASPNAKQLIDTRVLAYHYTVERVAAYCKETVFIRSDGGNIRVEYRRLGPPNEDADKANNPLIRFIVPSLDEYVFGRPLSLEFIRIVTRDDWSFDQVARFVWRYLSMIETFAKSAGMQVSMVSPYVELSGDFFDVIPQNIIIGEDGRYSFIDKEWQLAVPIEVGYLLFRSLLMLINSVTRFGRPVSRACMTRYQFIDGAFAAAGLRLQKEDYTRYITLEAEIQQSVTGRAAENLLTWGEDQPLPILSLSQAVAERDRQIDRFNQMLAEAEKFAQKTAQLTSERERLATEASHLLRGRLTELEQAVVEKDHHIFELRHSESYRFGLFCTWPLRKIWSLMKSPKQPSFLPQRLSVSSKHKEARRSILASTLLPSGQRHLYRMANVIHRHLPLPESWRVPLKQWVKGRLSGESPRIFPHDANIGAIKAARFRSLLPLRVYTAPRSGSCVNLVTDSVNAGSLFGGVATSIIFSALLAEKMGAKLRIITRIDKANEWNVRHVLECNSINWTKNIDFVFADIFNERVETEIGDRDLFVTTSWWTTSSVLRSIPEERVFYLLQEDERMFYPYGDDYLLCTELLKNSKLTFIINTKLLYDHFVESGFWNIRDRGIWFEPSFDIRTFFRESRGPREKKKFFFYARPNNLRNLFYRGLDAIERAVSLGTLELDGWEIYFAGNDVPNVQFGSSYHPHRIGNLSWAEYGALVRDMDLALCLMYSPHPSYPPLDLAASGAVVVTNRFGQKKNLDMYSKNILCSDLDVDSLAAGIAQAVSVLADDAQREQNYRDSRFMRHWRASFEPILSRLD